MIKALILAFHDCLGEFLTACESKKMEETPMANAKISQTSA